MQKALTVGGGTPPPPPPRSLRSLARHFYRPPLKLNPGYATGSELDLSLYSVRNLVIF